MCIRDSICALDYLKDNPGAHPINLGSGKGYSVLEVADAFERASGVKIPRVIAPRRDGDIARSYADASLAKEILHWEARRGIDEMCQMCIRDRRSADHFGPAAGIQ